jgi:hypothetical protein
MYCEVKAGVTVTVQLGELVTGTAGAALIAGGTVWARANGTLATAKRRRRNLVFVVMIMLGGKKDLLL